MNVPIILIALIVSAALYGMVAYLKSREIKTINQFFHIGNVKRGALSIVAGNLTLGTGLVYIASLAQKQAVFALVAPIGVLTGYLLLSRLVSVLSIDEIGERHDILDFICRGTGGKILYKAISGLIALTYLVLIPLEIYVSSTLFASIFASESAGLMAPVFAITIFTVVIVYSALGGLRGVVATDLIQLGFMGAMILIVLSGSWYFSKAEGESISLLPNVDRVSLVLLACSTFFTAVATQFYNIINVAVGNSFNSSDQHMLYKRTGLILFVVLLALVAVGAFASNIGSSQFGSIDILLSKLGAIEGSGGSWLVFFVVFGMVAVLISSADSGFIAISHTIYEKIAGNSSRSNEAGKRLLRVRLIYVVALNAVAAIPLIYIFQYRPNIISILVTAIAPLTIAAPLIASAALCTSKYGKSLLHELFISLPLMLAILYGWSMSISAAHSGAVYDGYLVVVVGVSLSMVVFLMDYLWSGRGQRMASNRG